MSFFRYASFPAVGGQTRWQRIALPTGVKLYVTLRRSSSVVLNMLN